jgi:hypothetical protein
MTTMVALIFMATQGSGSAELNGAHDPPLITGQPMGFSISRAVLTEDLRHLQATRGSHLLSGLRNWFVCSIEGTEDLGQVQTTDMQVDGGGGGRSVAQKPLDMVETCACFNQMGGKGMPQGMDAGRFRDAGTLFGSIKH